MHHKRRRQDGSLVCAWEDAAMGLWSTFAVGRKWVGRGGYRAEVPMDEPQRGFGEGQGFGSLPDSLFLPGVMHGIHTWCFSHVLCCSHRQVSRSVSMCEEYVRGGIGAGTILKNMHIYIYIHIMSCLNGAYIKIYVTWESHPECKSSKRVVSLQRHRFPASYCQGQQSSHPVLVMALHSPCCSPDTHSTHGFSCQHSLWGQGRPTKFSKNKNVISD